MFYARRGPRPPVDALLSTFAAGEFAAIRGRAAGAVDLANRALCAHVRPANAMVNWGPRG